MYLLREGSENSKDKLFVNVMDSVKLNSDDTSNKVMFFPELHQAYYFHKIGMPEKQLISWVKDNLMDPKKNFIDIGAHVGTYTFNLAPYSLNTWSFECSPKTFCYLAANVALYDLTDKVKVYPFAIGNPKVEEEHVTYYVRSEDGGGNGIKKLSENDENKNVTLQKSNIQLRSLDSFKIDNIGLIKIDVEGAELDVLLGAKKTLERSNYPPILFESWGEWKEAEGVPANKLKRDVINCLNNYGYTVQIVQGALDMYLATKEVEKSDIRSGESN